jgi:hypothetical protein
MKVLMSKPFDSALYDADDAAKHIVVEWLKSRGHDVWVNPDQFGIDLLDRFRGYDYAWEVEVKHNWSGYQFPFDSVHYSLRKRKFIDPEVRTYFVTLNHELDRLLVVSGKDFLEGKLVQKSTIYTRDEWFVEIPIRRAIFMNLSRRGNDTNAD